LLATFDAVDDVVDDDDDDADLLDWVSRRKAECGSWRWRWASRALPRTRRSILAVIF